MGPKTKALKPIHKTTVVDGILSQLKSLIREEHYGAGSRLPSERDLARSLGVSRPSVREALRTLELMGVVKTRQGSGTQVAGSGSDILSEPLEFLFALDHPSIEDLHETRTLLEVHLAARAAQQRDDADLAALDSALRDMRSQASRAEPITDPDVRFHQAVATASKNRVLERIMNCLQLKIRALIDAAWPGNTDLQFSHESHEKILDALRRRDPRAARDAMQEHMDVTRDELRRAGLIR
jgi:GntR family transcriptional repressor for pyruvate dehydrogenase complex